MVYEIYPVEQGWIVDKYDGCSLLSQYLVTSFSAQYSCTCPGFRYYRKCKHIKMVRDFRRRAYVVEGHGGLFKLMKVEVL
jgi:hypothetical protein